MIFRLYSEVLWYPGRQLNIMNMLQGSSVGTNHANATPTPPVPAAESAPPTPTNKFSSIFSGLKSNSGKEEKVIDYKYVVQCTACFSLVYLKLSCSMSNQVQSAGRQQRPAEGRGRAAQVHHCAPRGGDL